MALKNYRWRGYTWQIDEKDLDKYPGAELIVEPRKDEAKRRTSPQNKSRRAPKDK